MKSFVINIRNETRSFADSYSSRSLDLQVGADLGEERRRRKRQKEKKKEEEGGGGIQELVKK